MIFTATVMEYIPTNAYFYIDDETKHGFLIDPGAQAKELLKLIREKDLTIEKILLTHGHADHIGAVNELQKALDVSVIMGEHGRDYSENPVWNLSTEFGKPICLENVTYMTEGSRIALKGKPDFFVTVINAPGHTTDGVLYYSEKDSVAFVGDTIFKASFGRTDMYGGDYQTLMQTIREKVLTLPDDTILLSGHSEPTSVAEEKGNSYYSD